MRRLIINSNLVGAFVGIGGFVISRLVIALQAHRDFNEWSAFAAFFLTGWGVVFPPLFILGLFALPIERRLKNAFRLSDLPPAEAACQRTVTLRVPGAQFLAEVRRVLVNSRVQILRVIGDPTSETTLTCYVRHAMLYEYEISVEIAQQGAVAHLVVRRRHPLARFVTVELGTVQLLAGLLKWTADRSLIVRDFSEHSRPERLDKDLGSWLPTGDLVNVWSPLALESMKARDRQRAVSAGVRMIGAAILGTGAFLALAWIEGPELHIPRLVKWLPLFVLLVYVNAQLVRSFQPGDPKRPKM